MLGQSIKVQLKSSKITPNKKKPIYISNISTNTGAILLKSIKPTIKASLKPSVTVTSKRTSLNHYHPTTNTNTNTHTNINTHTFTHTHTNIQSTLSSINQFTPTNQHKIINTKPSHSYNTNKQRISATSSIAKGKEGGDYAKIFHLLNSEIREITDLFKRTQSVDQQTKKEEILLKQPTKFNNDKNIEDIDYVLFEKCLCEEEEKDEKVLDISNLEESEAKKMNNMDSVLFSSYNSEFYYNLNKEDGGNAENDCSGSIADVSLSSMLSGHNVIKIAKANVFKNKHSRQKSISVVNDNNDSDKTECQYQDVVFNKDNNNNSIISEKTTDMMNEKEREINYVPIQEVMKQIRNNKSHPIKSNIIKDDDVI